MSIAPTSTWTAANLKAEIQSGPYATTFAPQVTAQDWPDIANLLNSKTASAAGPVNHADMQAQDVSSVVNYGEFRSSVTANDMQTWQTILGGGNGIVKIGSSNIQGFINAAFASCPTSLSALQGLYTQQGSRAEILYGQGRVVQPSDVQFAMTGTGSFSS